jgi:hypothetical protein
MKSTLFISLLLLLMFATGVTALALVDDTAEPEAMGLGDLISAPQMESQAQLPVNGVSAQPLAQTALATVNALEIQDPNPTCGRPFAVHVNVTNQSGAASLPGTVTLQNIHRGTGSTNYTGYQNYPVIDPGGNFVVVFQVLVNSYVSEGQELVASTNGSTFSTKYDIKRGGCSKTSSSAVYSHSLQVSHSQKCMDVPGGSSNAVTPIQQFSCTGANNQEWSVESVGNGYYRIVSRFSGMCLDVKGFSQQPHAVVQQYPCNGGDNQSFTFRKVSGDYNLIVAKHSGMCLDVKGASTADLAPIQQYSCHGNSNQQWRYR